MELEGKIIIKGKIIAETGLHIGGNKATKRIGELDNPVIKDGTGKPYIPGSSLKGKIRSMLAKKEGSYAVSKKDLSEADKHLKTDESIDWMMQIFGSSGDNDKGNPARLIVRDAYLENIGNAKTEFLDDEYTQFKWENTVDRKTGTAKHPRQQERVPAGAIFCFEMIYDVFKETDYQTTINHLNKILQALKLLQHDYIGGSGSRGYGKISFQIEKTPELWKFENENYQRTETIAVTLKNVLDSYVTSFKNL